MDKKLLPDNVKDFLRGLSMVELCGVGMNYLRVFHEENDKTKLYLKADDSADPMEIPTQGIFYKHMSDNYGVDEKMTNVVDNLYKAHCEQYGL